MTVEQSPDKRPGDGPIERARVARLRASARLADAITDFFLHEDARLDDRTRVVLARVLGGVVAAVEADILRHAARLLATRGATVLAETLLSAEIDVIGRLTRAGLLADAQLIGELLARVREDEIADALPIAVAGDAPSLLVRLTDVPDTVVASAARALMAAAARRRTGDEGHAIGTDLPGDLHHRLVWWVAAAIREASLDRDDPDVDRALGEAALRSVGAHDEGERMEAVATRLALAIDARAYELAPLLLEALGDRQLALFVAVLGQAVGLDYPQMRDVVLEPEGDQLWLALRAAGLERATIAQVGLALADADSRRDVEALADMLDEVVAITPDAARGALAPLALHPDFRAAMTMLARSARR